MKELFYRVFALVFNACRMLFPLRANRVTLLSPHNAHFNDGLGEIKKELEKTGEYEFNYISHEDFSSPLKAIAFFTKKAYLLATSALVFMNDNFMPMGYLNFRREVKIVQLWHGEGAFKKYGLDVERPAAVRKRELAANSKLTHVICSSPDVRAFVAGAFGVEQEKVLSLGSPRAAALLRANNAAELRAAFEAEHPEAKGKKIVLYAPTFRDDPELDAKFLSAFDAPAFLHATEQECFLMVRLHPQVHSNARLTGVLDVTEHKSVNELTLISDVLITDYSSVCMDFVLLDKPCVFFVPDMEEYTKHRSFYFDFEKYVPGKIAKNTAELAAAVLSAGVGERAREFKKFHLSAVNSDNTRNILREILTNNG